MIRAFFELSMCIALIIGFIYEDEIINFEMFLKNRLRKALYKKLCTKRKRKTVKYDILECEDDNCVFLIPRK